MISFPCPHCGQKLSVRDELAGKSGKCPSCKKSALVPAASSTGTALRKTGGSMVLPPSTPTQAGIALEGTIIPGSTALDDEVDYRFLAPAQRSDEIGRLGPYRVLKVLGAGGMGVVFKAEDPQLERPVALKVMLPALAANANSRQRFLREAKTTAAIKHEHIVGIYQVSEDRGVPFLAMEFLEGEALDQRLIREGKLPVPEALRIGREMAEGLGAAHARGLIHRDIKPQNVWLEKPKGKVRILDFGLARLTTEDSQLTQAGSIIGTPAYMSPEQACNQTLDARSDLFSLGSVIYRMSVGKPAFQGTNTLSTLRALAIETPQAPQIANPEVPEALARLIMQLLTKEATGRPASAQVVAETIAAIEQQWSQPTPVEMSGESIKPLLETRAPSGKKRGMGLLLGGAGALVLLVGAALAFFVLKPRGSQETDDGGTSTVTPATQDPFKPTFTWPKGMERQIDNSIGMKLMLIPPGTFLMGASEGELERLPFEGPVHSVMITKPFYMGAYEVTQPQYERLMKKNPSRFKNVKQGLPNPVEGVSFADAQEFCKKLSDLEAEKKAGRVYRLPTEAEWEYACRAGTQTMFHFGNEPNKLGEYGWYKDNAGKMSHPVGQLKPNAWGLYDMHGNVGEWCSDWYTSSYYAELRKDVMVKDPTGPATGDQRIYRGGNFNGSAGRERCGARIHVSEEVHGSPNGFRVVCTVGALSK